LPNSSVANAVMTTNVIRRENHMPMFYSVSGLARHFGVAPRKISDLFYARRLDDERCPVIDGRRIIPADYVPAIEAALREVGELPPATTSQDRANH
jgi:hypothetical protein